MESIVESPVTNRLYQGNNIRTIEREGEMWWVAKDVCEGKHATTAKSTESQN